MIEITSFYKNFVLDYFLNNENAADKEDLYSCVAVFCSSASSLIHFSLGIWSQAGSEEENWQIAQ